LQAARAPHHVAVRQQVAVEVLAHAHAAEDADEAAVCFRVVAGVFQRLPAVFEEEANLRLHPLGLARAEVEEGGVEQLHVVEDAARPDVVRRAQHLFVEAEVGQLALGEGRDGLDAVAQVLPEPGDVARAGEAPRQADDGDVFERLLGLEIAHFPRFLCSFNSRPRLRAASCLRARSCACRAASACSRASPRRPGAGASRAAYKL
jgi:hypothetical protein